MKTKNLSVISFCLIVTVVVACRKEYKSFFSESQSNHLKWAKDYFNNSLLTNTWKSCYLQEAELQHRYWHLSE